MKIWILGAEGLLGRELVQLCKERNISYIASGREVDLTDPLQLLSFAKLHRPSHAINCAAYTDVDRAEMEKERAYAVNATGPQNLARVAKECHFRLIHVSTDYVFDGQKKVAYNEQDACQPLNIYGKSKRLGEEYLLQELPSACVVRTSWLFGEGGKNYLSKLIPLIQAHEKLQIDNEQINRPTSVHDLAEGLLKMVDCSGIWHFANRGEVTRYQIALYVWDQAKKRNLAIRCREIIPTPSMALPAPRPTYSALSTDKIENLIGPLKTWQEVF